MTLPQAKPSSPQVVSGLPKYYRNMFIFGVIAIGAIALVGDHVVEEKNEIVGYWGPVTSTMDWCEANYAVTPYIAEFYNTISNLGYVIIALLGILFHLHAELRFIIAYASIAVIGVGSSMFHATLLYSAQLCDELPMFYLICVLYYIVLEHNTVHTTYKLLPWGLAIGVTIFTVIYYYYPFPMLFQVGWGLFVMYTTYMCVERVRNIPREDRKMGDVGLVVMIISIVLWVSEQAFCSPTIRLFRLHALWHLGTAYAAYTSVTAMWYYRAKYILEYKAKLHYLPVPHVVTSTKST